MGKEQLGQTPESEADTTIYREPHEPAGDQPSLSKKAAQDDCQDGEDGLAHEPPDNANPGEVISRTTTGQDTYISGIRLILVWMPLSLVAFLMLLDISIVATVKFLIEPLLYSTAHDLTIQYHNAGHS